MFCFFNSDADEKAEVGTTPSVLAGPPEEEPGVWVSAWGSVSSAPAALGPHCGPGRAETTDAGGASAA